MLAIWIAVRGLARSSRRRLVARPHRRSTAQATRPGRAAAREPRRGDGDRRWREAAARCSDRHARDERGDHRAARRRFDHPRYARAARHARPRRDAGDHRASHRLRRQRRPADRVDHLLDLSDVGRARARAQRPGRATRAQGNVARVQGRVPIAEAGSRSYGKRSSRATRCYAARQNDDADPTDIGERVMSHRRSSGNRKQPNVFEKAYVMAMLPLILRRAGRAVRDLHLIRRARSGRSCRSCGALDATSPTRWPCSSRVIPTDW